jgi:hypothetical protein
MFMNDWDLADAHQRFTRSSKPNRLALVMVVDNLREWTDSHSDGWAYWRKARQSAARAISHIESGTYQHDLEQEDNDITDAEMRAAIRPIKAFLTRQEASAEEREFVLRAVEAS